MTRELAPVLDVATSLFAQISGASVGLTLLLVGVPVGVLVILALATYVDARSVGMNAAKWALIVLFVPLVGFAIYLFERSERRYDPATDPYADRGYNWYDTGDETDREE